MWKLCCVKPQIWQNICYADVCIIIQLSMRQGTVSKTVSITWNKKKAQKETEYDCYQYVNLLWSAFHFLLSSTNCAYDHLDSLNTAQT